MKTILVVDGNSIVNRAFFGVKDGLSTQRGFPTNAVFGFVNIINRICEEYKPDVGVVAFDVHAPTFRHKMYDGYKAGRRPMPEELCVQMPYASKIAAALGFTVIEREGYEADDVLGTVSKLGDENGCRTLLLTGDKDSLQLISDNTAVLLAVKGEYPLFDRKRFFDEYGIMPEQFIDLKAIMGDSSDSYYGVPGIGEKGALDLMKKFGSLDAIYEQYALPESGLKPGTVSKLEAGRDSAYFSKTLAAIYRQVPDISLENLPDMKLDRQEAKKLFVELELGGFIRKFGLDRDDDAPKATLEIRGVETLDGIISDGSAISVDEDKIYVYDGERCFCAPENAENYKIIAANADRLICRDAKAICRRAETFGVHVRGFSYDIMLAAYVIDPQCRNGIEEMVTAFLGDVRQKETPDAVYVAKLKPELDKLLSERNGEKLFREIEMPLSDVLTDMETAGFLIDLEGLEEYGKKLTENIDGLTYGIYAQTGFEFNINSPKQLGEVLFEKMGLPYDGKKGGSYSTSAEILEKLAPYSPVVADILEYRKLTKLLGTYVKGLAAQADSNGTVHTSFRQTGTATGRLSSAEPNLQNIPVKTEEGRIIRNLFKARPGHVLIDADYSQIELRLMASISGDENMINAFNTGVDIHASTAAKVFRIPLESVTSELRKRAKAVNFGIIYGIGAYSLSQDLGISQKEAKQYIQDYLNSYPAVSEYLDNVVEQAKKDGSVTTLFGRKRYIPEINASNGMLRKFGERVAMNSPLQGTAADIIKIAMINVSKRLKEEQLDAELILQVHDELIIDSAAECADRASEILRECMENAAKLPVALTVELTRGERWEKT